MVWNPEDCTDQKGWTEIRFSHCEGVPLTALPRHFFFFLLHCHSNFSCRNSPPLHSWPPIGLAVHRVLFPRHSHQYSCHCFLSPFLVFQYKRRSDHFNHSRQCFISSQFPASLPGFVFPVGAWKNIYFSHCCRRLSAPSKVKCLGKV